MKLDFTEFKELCLKGKCTTCTLTSKHCLTETKIKSCYSKYLIKLNKVKEKNKQNKNDLWKETLNKVKERDKTCRIWNILTLQEQLYIKENYYEDFKYYGKIMTGAHIIPRSKAPDKVYDLDNIILISMYHHQLLDKYLHPVTRNSITSEERMQWMLKAQRGN